MAYCIPDRLPSKASRGEDRTFHILKKLPDNYLVYYEPNISNRRPDFIVIAPDMGVIVIEVKGWYIDDILYGNDSEVVILDNNLEKRATHPLEQARQYMWRLVKACQNNPHYTHLLHQEEGPLKNKFKFPFAHFVILSNITQTQLKSKLDNDLSLIFRPENTMTRDHLLKLEDAPPEEIAQTLKGYFDPYWEIDPLNDEEIDVLRAVVRPEIIISYLKTRGAVPESVTESLKVLDRRQENNSRKIGEGHRILCGIAGSGKTVLLIARARLIHDQQPEANILLLCYNVSLALYLKHVLKDYPRIKVTHFDGWAKWNGVSRYTEDPATGKVETDENLGERLSHHLNTRLGDFRKYDAILIDEAQDFHPKWFSCVLVAMKDPYDGDLLIVCDGNQGIRPIEGVSWKSLGIRAQGRTIHRALDLDKNYRNTQEILKLASLFAVKESRFDEDTFGIIPVNPEQAIRTGKKPFVIQGVDHRDECLKTIHIVKDLLEGKLPDGTITAVHQPKDIGILYRKASSKDKELLKELISELSQIAPIVWVSEGYYSRSRVLEGGIKLQTVDSAKGLQYKTVIILWADAFSPFHEEDLDLERRRLYVALTRAEENVIISYSKTNDFVDIIRNSDFITEIPTT